MRDPNAKTLVNKALVEEMRASARREKASSGPTPVAAPGDLENSAPPSVPNP